MTQYKNGLPDGDKRKNRIEFRKLCPLCHLYQDIQNPTCYKCDMKLNNSTIIKREYDEHGSLIKTGLAF